MPYDNLKDLPKGVRNNLPNHAQEIYKEAYNNAWEQYNHDEERAYRIAWSAVKNVYEKNEETGEWERKEE